MNNISAELPTCVLMSHVQNIIKETIITHPTNTTTIAVLVLQNGATAIGINYGTIDIKDNNREVAINMAIKDAMEKVFELENYLLRQKHYELNLKKEADNVVKEINHFQH